MWIRRKPVAVDFGPEVVEVLFIESSLEVGACVYAGRCMTLHVDVVAASLGLLSLEEVVEADLVESC